MPQDAVHAYTELNGTMYQGRMFHVLPGKSVEKKSNDNEDNKNYKDKKLRDMKKNASSSHNWNSLFMGMNAISEDIAKRIGKSKVEILDTTMGGSAAAVRLALGETQVVLEMKQFLESNGVRLEAFESDNVKRSKTIILVKNLPASTELEEIESKFAAFGVIQKIILPPNGITCLVKFENPSEARKAFKNLAYTKYKHLPLFLEWAPENTFRNKEEQEEHEKNTIQLQKPVHQNVELMPDSNSTLFIKNLSLETTEETLKNIFGTYGMIHNIEIVKKKSFGDESKEWIPLGYGFIQYKLSSSADNAIKNLQHKEIDGNKIELKRSDRITKMQTIRKSVNDVDQKESTKIMVRNIPFQANSAEIRLLIQTFGEIKAIRLPKKSMPGVEQHRGFGFVDFVNKSDAKNAFYALHHSTHLYGRRLVLEWAATEENVGEIRKRTANDSNIISFENIHKKPKKSWLKDEIFLNSNKNEMEENSL